jgi:hypothetical protein
MASFEGESARVIDKFIGENFNLWRVNPMRGGRQQPLQSLREFK